MFFKITAAKYTVLWEPNSHMHYLLCFSTCLYRSNQYRIYLLQAVLGSNKT